MRCSALPVLRCYRRLHKNISEGIMRIEIKTKGKRITDRDVRALYMILNALNNSSSHMKVENLRFFAEKLGYEIVPKRG